MLGDILQLFGRVSGYKVNISKSVTMSFNVPPGVRNQVGTLTAFPWDTCVKYLCVWLVDYMDPSVLMDLNLNLQL